MRSTIKQFLFRPGVRPHRILGGALKGFRFNLDLRADTQVWRGIYERRLQSWIVRNTTTADVCLDIGAADGYFSLLLALSAGPSGMVHAFQPDNRANQITDNFALNRQRALAPCEVHRSYVVGPHSSDIPRSESGADLNEPIIIDEFVETAALKRVDVVKIDVDGAETQVLEGMTRTLSRFKPHLFVEVHSKELLSKVSEMTQRHGYQMCLEMPPAYEYRPISFNAFLFSTGRPALNATMDISRTL